jgi:hypothetical protein
MEDHEGGIQMRSGIMFPEIVERDIKQKVRACSKDERRWILEAFTVQELQDEVNRRTQIDRSAKDALMEVARQIESLDARIATGRRAVGV